MTTADTSAFLRISLRANAAFSGLSGVLFVAAGTAVAGFLDVQTTLVTVVGGNLLGFAGALVILASRPEIPRRLVLLVIALDVVWVLLTLALVTTGVFTGAGATATLLVGSVVLGFAFLQSIGVRRLDRATIPAAAGQASGSHFAR